MNPKPPKTPFSVDPIAATTDRAYDKMASLFGKQAPTAEPKIPAPSARPSMRPSPEHPGLDPERDVVPVEKDPTKATYPAWARRGVQPPVEEGEVEESALQAWLGREKYGKEGMEELQRLGREHASKEKVAKAKAKFAKEEVEGVEEGNIKKTDQGIIHTSTRPYTGIDAKKIKVPVAPGTPKPAKAPSRAPGPVVNYFNRNPDATGIDYSQIRLKNYGQGEYEVYFGKNMIAEIERTGNDFFIRGYATAYRSIEEATRIAVELAAAAGEIPRMTPETEQDVAEARLLSQHENGNRSVKIFRDTVYDEYVVSFYLNGEHQEKADYHTDDKQDAANTARHWLKSGNPAAGSNISESLKTRVIKNLVRIEDVLENRRVYGGVDRNDQRLVRAAIKESMRGGIAFEDAILSMIEGFKEELDEYAPVGTAGATAPGAAPGAKPAAGAAPETQANAAPAAAGTVQSKPVSSQGVEALGQVLRNAGLTPGQLSTVTTLARKD